MSVVSLIIKLAAAFHSAGAFRFRDFSADVRACRDYHFAVNHNGEKRLEIDGVAGTRAARRDRIVQYERNVGAGRHFDLADCFAGGSRV